MIRIRLLFLGVFVFNLFHSVAQELPKEGPLTIDPQLQSLAEYLMLNKQGSIVAIEPETGRILAMVSHDHANDSINRAVSKSYSPGSTFKVAQALEMLSEGTLTPATSYPCSKGFTYNGISIRCHTHRAPLSLVQAIAQSCNSYFCKAFQEMIDNRTAYPSQFTAINRWAECMRSLGLGRRLGVDLPGEVKGVVPNSAYLRQLHKRWNGTTIMWVGMGQGEIKTTPLQLCNLAAIIANRGFYYIPHVREDSPRLPLDVKYKTKHTALPTAEAFKTVVHGMRAAVVNGTCASINNPMYKICGKTGTAENQGKDHSVFIGFAPMNQPRIAVSVYVENGGFGADLAAPLAALVIEQYLNGKLSARSEHKADKWSAYHVKVSGTESSGSSNDL